MRLLELFAGSRSVGKVAEMLGYEVFSVDIEPFEGIHLVKDIEMLEPFDIPLIPDVIWASPPCTTYSIAAISHHRNGVLPKSDEAVRADRLLEKTFEVIGWFPNAQYYVENPVGMMRKVLEGYDRRTVTYCAYGDSRMKPTDIFTNNGASLFNSGWQPRPRCKNGDRCHEAAPRGSRTGTQGLNGAYERGKIPPLLVTEILQAARLSA